MGATPGWVKTFALMGLLLPFTACGMDGTGVRDGGGDIAQAGVVSAAARVAPGRSFPVSGSAVHFFTTGVVHSREPTANGHTQLATETIRISGDLNGYILYHPTSEFDFTAGTLVNTGTQIFSGTVAGSSPVILHDDEFRFDVDLGTGATTGRVRLRRSQDSSDPGHWFECDLDVVGTGLTPEGDSMADYTGTCTEYGRRG